MGPVGPRALRSGSRATRAVTLDGTSGAWSREVLKDARPLRLGTVAASEGAIALVEELLPRCLEADGASRSNRRGRSGTEKLSRAVGAIVGSVLDGWLRERPYAVFLSRSAAAFTGELVGEAAFRAAESALVGLGLVDQSQAVAFPLRAGWVENAYQRKAARLRPTDALLAEAATHGITVATAPSAFRVEYPATPLVVKPADLVEVRVLQTFSAKKAQLSPGRLATVERRSVFTGIREDVAAMNQFASEHRFDGCRPPSWKRVFTASVLLNGRWQAQGISYQVLPKAERAALRIDGETVVELDIRASHLTILAALAGASLPEGDPYAVPGIPRNIVKRWVVVTLGNGRCPTRWSPRTREEEPDVAAWPIKEVAAAVLARLPFLDEPASPEVAKAARIAGTGSAQQLPRFLSLRLMGIEAEAMTLALRRLREGGLLGLSVHDSLIVPRRSAATAQRVLEEACQETYGVVPVITSSEEAALS